MSNFEAARRRVTQEWLADATGNALEALAGRVETLIPEEKLLTRSEVAELLRGAAETIRAEAR